MNTPPKHKHKVVIDPSATSETDDLNTDEAVAARDTQIKSANEANGDEQVASIDANNLNVDQSKVGLNNETNEEFL